MNNQITAFSQRNLAIDMLRALTMFTMIFVNDFWKVHDVPHWLEHAVHGEDFMGLADFVFPCFLFAVGMSIPYAIERRFAKGYSAESTLGHILSRTFALLVMGSFIGNSEARLSPEVAYPIGVYWFIMAFGFIALWNQYPKITSRLQKYGILILKVLGFFALLYLALTFRSKNSGDVFAMRGGILGSIGWTYLVCAVVYLLSRNRLKYLLPIFAAFIVIGFLGTPLREAFGGEPILNFPRGNFYNGMLGLLYIGNGGAVSLAMGGVLLSVLSARHINKSDAWKMKWTLILSASFLLLGVIEHNFWIAAKIGLTPVCVCYIIAVSVLIYGIFTYLANHKLTGWFKIIRPAGTATLTTYLIPYVFYGMSDVTGIILPDWATHGFMGLVNCFCFALIVIAVTGILEKLHIKLKI